LYLAARWKTLVPDQGFPEFQFTISSIFFLRRFKITLTVCILRDTFRA
jgi:hypothetical protein